MNDFALVTEASSPLGRAVALRLAADGYHLALHTRGAPVELATLCDEVKAMGGRALAVHADIQDEAEVTRMVSAVEHELGPLSLVVNNVGLVHDDENPQLSTPDAKVHEANLRGALHVCRAVVAGMRRRRRGRIINICSLAEELTSGGKLPAQADRTGLNGLTKALARDLAREHVTVNSICPGLMAAAMERLPRPVRAKAIARIPLGRFGEPSAVGEAVAYLAGPGGDWVTGQVLHINGGMTM